jgi:phosphoglucosamine mutase
MTRKLFGTDGVRGVAGEFLTAELALALGRAATRETRAERPQVLIVRDTRESGEMLQAALAAGVSAAGGDALLGGVLPTPAAPLLIAATALIWRSCCLPPTTPTRTTASSSSPATASSSPTSPSSRSSTSSTSRASWPSRAMMRERQPLQPPAAIGRIRELRGAPEDYLRELHVRFEQLDLHGVDVLLDCANGATYQVAPEIFRRLGASVSVIADTPDGRNINAGCGSTHLGAWPSVLSLGATRSGSRSTATVTVCSRLTATVLSSTAMS